MFFPRNLSDEKVQSIRDRVEAARKRIERERKKNPYAQLLGRRGMEVRWAGHVKKKHD